MWFYGIEMWTEVLPTLPDSDGQDDDEVLEGFKN